MRVQVFRSSVTLLLSLSPRKIWLSSLFEPICSVVLDPVSCRVAHAEIFPFVYLFRLIIRSLYPVAVALLHPVLANPASISRTPEWKIWRAVFPTGPIFSVCLVARIPSVPSDLVNSRRSRGELCMLRYAVCCINIGKRAIMLARRLVGTIDFGHPRINFVACNCAIFARIAIFAGEIKIRA